MAQVLTHESSNFLTSGEDLVGVHEVPQRRPWELALYRGQFPGVRGESHIVDLNKGRDIYVPVRYRGFATEAAMDAFLNDVADAQGTLTGTLTIDTTTYESCTFVSIEEIETRFLDGSGVWGWTTKALLYWRQREPNAPPPEPDP